MQTDKRIIMHIDMNSYFASVEQQANLFLREKPVGITGKHQERSVIATASLEAKRLGVKTAMSTWKAKQICPSLILYPGDPEKYSYITDQFNTIFREFADQVEQFSVDESFLDVTHTAQDYIGAISIALIIRERIKETCGERITCSIGIAPNKLVAKLCSESVKPNGLTVVRPQNVLQFIDSCKLQDMCGIGPNTEQHLHSLGIYTFEQLRTFPSSKLVDEFKSYGYWLRDSAHGCDESSVTDSNEDPKSIGHSYTLPENTNNEKEMRQYLLELADRVAWRLRKHGFVTRCVHTYVRHGDFSGMSQQKSFAEPTADGLVIFKIAWQMIKKWLDNTKSVRLLGISVSNLCRGSAYIQLFKKERRALSLQNSLDTLRHRYGPIAWTRVSLLKTNFKTRSSGFHFDHE